MDKVFYGITRLSHTSYQALSRQYEHYISEQELEKVISYFLAAGPEAVRETKKLTRSIATKANATKVIAERRVSAEGQEGLKSFFEKRNPSWSKS